MNFCKDCGTRLKFKLVKTGDNTVAALACDNCGYFTETENKIAQSVGDGSSSTSIKVVGSEENDMKSMPTVAMECPKCQHGTAFWWLLQTRSGDEATTQFFRCEKCNHTWRQYA